MSAGVGIDVIVPFYENPHLVDQVGANLLALGAELSEAGARIVFVNDSPGSTAVSARMEAWRPRLGGARVVLLKNEVNLGFVRSTNQGLRLALSRGADALLLNSDVVLGPGTVREMTQVARVVPGCGFVNPRSNNATICSLPYEDHERPVSYEDARRTHRRLSAYLPRWQYAPTGVGFCLLIRHQVLARFGVLDEIYGRGYNEENDLCMRALRGGLRVALSNRSFAYHQGAASFTSGGRNELEEKNRAILLSRYPEYVQLVDRYLHSPEFRYEQRLRQPAILAGRLPPPGLLPAWLERQVRFSVERLGSRLLAKARAIQAQRG